MPLHYQSGFGNEFATEALPGALPIGRNSPQRAPYGLYAEQLSGTAFTAPRHANRRSWLYRIRPAAVHGPFEAVQIGRVVGSFDELPVSPDQLRWDPLPLPHGPADFLEGFPPRWLTAEDTFRPPWFHRNFASEFMGLIHGAYDAKAEGFAPGGASLHNCMRGHGPDAETFARASVADTSRPHHVADTMAFMFETPAVIRPTVYALESAQLQNLPLGVFRRAGTDEIFRGGVAIGDQIVDLGMAASRGALSPEALPFAAACGASSLNSFMAMGPNAWSALRLALSRALRIGAPERELLSACLVPQSRAEYTVPAKIGDYTDFYTSIHHATSVGKLFRPDNPIAAAIWPTAIR